LIFQGQVEQQHEAKADRSGWHVCPRSARLNNSRKRPIRDSRNGTPLGIAQKSRPSVQPDRLCRCCEVLTSSVKLRVGACIHDALGRAPEPIDGLVVCVGIEQPLTERLLGQSRSAIPDCDGGLQAFAIGSAEPRFPSRSFIARRMSDDAANCVDDALPCAERIEEAAGFRRTSFLLLFWRGPMAEPLVILSSLIHLVIVDDHPGEPHCSSIYSYS